MAFVCDVGTYEDVSHCIFSPRCTECPLKQCGESLKYREKQLILDAPVIKNIFDWLDAGMTDKQVVMWFVHIPPRRIRNWIKHRSSIQEKLAIYSTY